MATKLEQQTLEILVGARALLLQRGIWCKGTLVEYKNAEGDLILVDDIFAFPKGLIPHRVCAVGAAAVQPAATKRVGNKITVTRAYDRALKILSECVPDPDYGGSVVDYNDRDATTKRQVIKIYDTAITKAGG